MVYAFFDKRSKKVLGSGVNNQQLANELHKPIIKKFKRRKEYSSFKDNIWGLDLADMSLINLIKELNIYCVLLIHLVDMLGLLL